MRCKAMSEKEEEEKGEIQKEENCPGGSLALHGRVSYFGIVS